MLSSSQKEPKAPKMKLRMNKVIMEYPNFFVFDSFRCMVQNKKKAEAKAKAKAKLRLRLRLMPSHTATASEEG